MTRLRNLSLAAALRTEAADIANDNRRELVLDGAKEIEQLVQSNRELIDCLKHALEDLEKLNVGHAIIEDVCGVVPEIRQALRKAGVL